MSLRPSKKAIERASSRASKTYGSASYVQRELGSMLIERLTRSGKAFGNVLDLGCGDGLIVLELVEALGVPHVTLVDFSEEMVEMAKKRLGATSIKATFLQMDIEEAVSKLHGTKFSCIFSNSTLQWIEDLPMLLCNIRSILAPGGIFACSIFLRATLRELAFCLKHIKGLDRPIPSAGFFSKDELERLLCFHFRPLVKERVVLLRSYESAYSLLRGLKRTGVTPSLPIVRRRTLLKRDLKRLQSCFDERFGGVLVTFEALLYLGIV